MRTIFCLLTLTFAIVSVAAGEEKIVGKQHDYDPDKLPEVIKVKAGDSIVVTFKQIKPHEVESCQTKSNNSDVTFKNEGTTANFQIILRSDKKGQAKISWILDLESGITKANKGQQVEFE